LIQIESIPKWLRDNGRFVLRRGKIPYTKDGRPANPTNPSDGCSAAEALAAWANRANYYDGIGIMIIPPLVGIDLDHVVADDGSFSPIAEKILDTIESYTEISPSGKGIHLLGLAEKANFAKENYYTKNSTEGIEVYFENRYFTFTGKHLVENEIQRIDAEIQTILDTYMKRKAASTESINKTRNAPRNPDRTVEEAAIVIARMQRGADWETINRLLAGEDITGNTSEDDMSLMNRVAFYSCCDADVMDYIYRNSERYRSKWDERRGAQTYGEITIARAIQDRRDVWDPDYSNIKAQRTVTGAEALAVEWLQENHVASNPRYSLDDI